MAPNFVNKIGKAVKGAALFLLRSTVGYMPMMLLRLISRKINEGTAVQSAQHQREYAQQLANRMKAGPVGPGGPGGPRPQMVGTHYQPPYYYNEPAYNKEVSPRLDVNFD